MTLKERLLSGECFMLTIGEDTAIYRVLMGSPIRETLFYCKSETVNGEVRHIFCRMKLPNEIEQDDFFVFTDKYLDRLIADNKVEFWI